MSRAEEFIKAKTRNGSNTTNGWRRKGAFIPSYSLPWLTPEDARKAVEIAREEIYEWLKEHSQEYVYWMDEEFGKDDLINDLKQAMKDERV